MTRLTMKRMMKDELLLRSLWIDNVYGYVC
jgi:hypothetical protein